MTEAKHFEAARKREALLFEKTTRQMQARLEAQEKAALIGARRAEAERMEADRALRLLEDEGETDPRLASKPLRELERLEEEAKNARRAAMCRIQQAARERAADEKRRTAATEHMLRWADKAQETQTQKKEEIRQCANEERLRWKTLARENEIARRLAEVEATAAARKKQVKDAVREAECAVVAEAEANLKARRQEKAEAARHVAARRLRVRASEAQLKQRAGLAAEDEAAAGAAGATVNTSMARRRSIDAVRAVRTGEWAEDKALQDLVSSLQNAREHSRTEQQLRPRANSSPAIFRNKQAQMPRADMPSIDAPLGAPRCMRGTGKGWDSWD